ncbi:MAG: M28 family peptidase, partial [Bacteroidota bacterium]
MIRKNTSASSYETPTTRWPHWLVVLSFLFALAIYCTPTALPKVQHSNADSTSFSAARAFYHLDFIAKQPRPVGSEGHRATRAYLLSALRQMGLQPAIQETTSVLRFPGSIGFSAATVKNVLVKIPGTASTGTIALDAHYDGAATGPAAGDVASGVVTLLETIRALSHDAPLKNDLVFVFADAEEIGDLGAHAFTTQHQWMKEVKLAINYESMGTRGPVHLYATNRQNAALVREFLRAQPSVSASSFTVGIFNLLPEQRLACDLQDYLDKGTAGMGFVFTGNSSAYHTALDNIDQLDPRTVQQQGEATLALVRHFGQLDLNQLDTKEAAVFFDWWPNQKLQYSTAWSFPFAMGGLLLLLAILGFHARQKERAMKKMIGATLVLSGGIVLTVLLSVGAWWLVRKFNVNLGAFLIGNWAIAWFLAAMLSFAAAVVSLLLFLARLKFTSLELLSGILLLQAFLSLLLGVIYPVGNYVFLWAGVAALPALILLPSPRVANWIKAMASAIAVIAVVGLYAPLLHITNPLVALLIRLDATLGMPVLPVITSFLVLPAALLFTLSGSY